MTVRHFDGVDDVISAEPLTPAFVGHGTLAAIWRAADFGNQGLASGEATGFERWSIQPVGGDLVYCDYGGFSGMHSWSADEWFLSIATKPSGTATVRSHSMPFSTGVWTHADGSSVGDDNGLGHTHTHFGWSLNNNFFLEGEIAVVGIWSGVVLSDAECESLESELSNWVGLEPTGLWAFDQEDVGDPVLDLSGNGFDQIAITGTSVLTGDDPPGFNFSLVTDTHFYRDGGVWVPTTRHVREGGVWVTL